MCDVCFSYCSPNGLSWLVQALYVNNSINEFMYGFLDVEEGYGFENQCSVKYGEWDICIHFNPNESPKLVESLRLLTLQTEKLVFLYCFDLFSSLMSCKIFFWGIYLILIKPMFISKMVLFAFVISQFFILSDEALMNSKL